MTRKSLSKCVSSDWANGYNQALSDVASGLKLLLRESDNLSELHEKMSEFVKTNLQ